jgi:MEDS: MEthanogen/methylotroph, DcmR Sensory domain
VPQSKGVLFHMNPNDQAIHFAGTMIGKHRHICALSYTGEQANRVLLPFIRDGLERGEKALHIVDPALRDQHLASLQAAGIDTSAEEREGHLDVRDWRDTYLRDGRFDQNRMIALVEETLQAGHKDGYRQTRVVAHMEWALKDMPGVNDFVEYEARLNHVLPKYVDTLICVYDCTKFRASVMMDIVRTHPLVIVGGLLQENPFFVPPEQFLHSLRERRAHQRNVA